MTIKAIETSYKGYRFRSRLEARWAVFFEALGVAWEYENEGFELPDGTRYLPDFYLYGLEVGLLSSTDDMPKEWLGKSDGTIITVESSKYALVSGTFGKAWFEVKPTAEAWNKEHEMFQRFSRAAGSVFLVAVGDPWNNQLIFYFDGAAVLAKLVSKAGNDYLTVLVHLPQDTKTAKSIWSEAYSNEAYLAVLAARSARFEHGETPSV